jgi:hypothetical protein
MSTFLIQESMDLAETTAEYALRGFARMEGVHAATSGKFGAGARNLQASQNTILEVDVSAVSGRYFSVAVWRYYSALPTSATGNIIAIGNVANANAAASSNSHVGIMTGASGGDILVHHGGSATVRATLSGAIVAGVWQHYELRCFCHASTGTLEVWIDGIKKVDLTGIDTLANGSVGTVKMGGAVGSTNSYVDDIVIQDDASTIPDQLGTHRIHTLLPNGAGTNTAWTGTNTDVDDPFGSDDGDTTFAVSTTLNAKQDYAVDNLSETPTTVHNVALTSVMRKTDSGTKAATAYIISNAVEDTGSENGTAEGYTTKIDMFPLNPDGATAWTPTTIDAILIGHEITT